MPELVAACPLCGSSDSQPFDQRQFHGRSVSNVICRECGLVYQSPRMTVVESQSFYESEYRLVYQGQAGPNQKDLSVQAARAQAALDFISSTVPTCTRHLDIGCSTGLLLKKFAGRYATEAVGIEPGTSYRQYAESQGLKVYPTLEGLEQASLAPFDLVSMMHVLEHLPDPVEYLQALRVKHLTPRGWLLLEVPNLYAHDCFEVAHLVSFSAHTLQEVLQKAGFKVVQLRAHGLPRSRLIPLYLSLLAQPDGITSGSPRPDHLVRAKRQLGFLRRRAVTRLFPSQAWIDPLLAGER